MNNRMNAREGTPQRAAPPVPATPEAEFRFDPPTSIAKCRERIERLVAEIQSIETILADKHRAGPGGKRLSTLQYDRWRARTLKSLRGKREELARLKAWLRVELRRIETAPVEVDPLDVGSMLLGSYKAIEMVKAIMGVDKLPPEVLRVHDTLRDHVTGVLPAAQDRVNTEAAFRPDRSAIKAEQRDQRRRQAR